MLRATVLSLFAGSLLATSAGAQQHCTRLGTWWQTGMLRLQQQTAEGTKTQVVGVERQYVDRRTMRRTATGYRLDIRRTKLGLRDETVDIGVDYGPTGLITATSGDTAALGRDALPLLSVRCSELMPGAAVPDRAGRVDSSRTPAMRTVTRVIAANSMTVGVPVDTLGQRLIPVFVRRAMTDSSNGIVVRQQPNQPPDTARVWTAMSGEEVERQLVRVSDGAVVYREQARRLAGLGHGPPADMKDTVPIRLETASVERVIDSSAAAGVLNFPRRGDVSVSAIGRDTAAFHYREWRGDTLILRIVRRNGWRDELRSVWRDSAMVSASLYEPGNAVQPPGPYWRPFRVTKGFLYDSGSKDSAVAVPVLPWGLALDGFEEMLVPALRTVPADEKPHRIALYAVVDGRGSWLAWTASVAARGNFRVAKLFTLQKKWAGSFIFTSAGELIFSSLGGANGVLRVPMAGTRLANALQAAQAVVKREDLVPVPAAPPVPATPPARKP